MAITVGELALPIEVPGLAAALAAIDRLDAAAAKAGARKIDVDATGTSGLAAATTQVNALNTAARTSSTQITASLRQTVAAVGTAARAEVAVVAQAAKASEAAVAASLRSSLSRATSTSALMARLAAGGARGSGAGAAGVAAGIAGAGAGRAAAGAALSSLPGTAGMMGGALAGGPVALGIAGIAALGATVAGVSRLASAAIPAVGDFNASVRLLGATSRLTQTPLSALTATAGDLRRQLGVTATEANGLTAAATRVTAAAGRASDTGRFLTSWMDLAAARGLSTSAAMALLSTNILENDEAVNRLGLSNPSVIYEKWAASMGTTAARMTDAQKATAMMNEVMAMGGRVAGEYEARMRGAEGAVERLDQAKQNFLITLGQAITGGTGYSDLLSAQTAIVERATTWVTAHRDEIGRWVVRLGDLVDGIGKVIDGLATLNSWIERIERLRPSGLLASLIDGGRRGGASAPAFVAPRGPIDAAFGAALMPAGAAAGAGLGGFGSPFGTSGPLVGGDYLPIPRGRTGTGTGGRTRAATTAAPSAPLDLVRTPSGFGGLSNIQRMDTTRRPIPLVVSVAPRIIAPGLVAELQRFYTNASRTISGGMAQGLSSAISASIASAFDGGGVAGVVKAFGATMLGAVGGIFVQLGETYLAYGGIMAALATLLPNPFTAGPAGIAIGVALIALGSALSAVASGAGKKSPSGGGGSFSAPGGGDTTTRTTLAPRAAPVGGQQAPTGRTGTLETPRPVAVYATIIGPNDPQAQRAVKQLITNAERRGIT